MIRGLVLLLVVAALGQAQPRLRPAHLWLEITSQGAVRATLTLPYGENPEALRQTLARSLGCAESPAEQALDDFRLRVQCPLDRPTPLRLRGKLGLSELTAALGPARADALEILITGQHFAWLRITPAAPQTDAASPIFYRVNYPLSEIPTAIDIEAGFPDSSLLVLGVGVLGLLLIPTLLLILQPQNLLHLQATMQGLLLAGGVGWTWILQHSQAFPVCAFLLPQWELAPLLVLTAPPLAAVWIGSRLASALHRTLTAAESGIDDLRAARHRRIRFWMGATIACSFSGFAGLFWTTGSLASIPASIVPALVCLVRLFQVARGTSRDLQQGELHQRMHALARHAGVHLRGITLLTAPTTPPLALATQWGVVVLSESLLACCSRREVDAIVCHELSHVNAGSGGAMQKGARGVVWVFLVAAILGVQHLDAVANAMPLLLIAPYFLFKWWRRAQERKADLDSVRWSGDPEALIMGLARLSYVHGMPLEWSAPASWFISHPSTLDRIQSIAVAGGVPASRIPELLESARSAAPDGYREQADIGEDAAFSPALLQSLGTRLAWYTLIAPVAVGLLVASVLRAAGLGGLPLLGAGTGLAAVLFYVALEMIIGSVRDRARQRAVVRHGEGRFTGLALSTTPRLYNGGFHYDFGVVRTSGKLLEFIGDRTRFSLDRRLVTRVWLGDGPRHYTPRKVVCVEYRATVDAPLSVFTLQSFDARLWPFTVTVARRLHRDVEAWHRRASTAEAPPEPCILPSDPGEPEIAVASSTVLKSAYTTFGVAFLLDATAGAVMMPGEWNPLAPVIPAAVCAAVAVFALLPHLRRSGRRTDPRASQFALK